MKKHIFGYTIAITSILKNADEEERWAFTLTPYLSFALILETQANAEIAELKSYEMIKVKPTYKWNDRYSNDFLDIPEDLVIVYDNISEETETWGTTTIINPPGETIIIQNDDGSSSVFQLDTESDPSTPVKYTTEDFPIDCGEVLPLTSSKLSAFCQSTKYNPIVALRLESTEDKIVPEVQSFNIHPNPSVDILYVEGLGGGEYLLSLIHI